MFKNSTPSPLPLGCYWWARALQSLLRDRDSLLGSAESWRGGTGSGRAPTPAAPGGLPTNSLRPSTPHHSPRRGPILPR